MKKNLLLFMMVLAFAMTALAGCGSKKTEDTSEVVGMFMEKKDFMFTVQDSAGTYYGFSFDKTPEGYENFNDGDKVKVTYTGTITEVDPFEGEIISIEKMK